MSITEQYNAVASQARTATERSVEVFRQGAERFTNQAVTLTRLPQVDLSTAVDQYFELVQHTVDANRDFVGKWVDLVTSLSTVAREQAETVGHVLREQTDRVADFSTEQAKYVETVGHEQAQAAEHADKAEARQARQAERQQQKEAHDKARESYADLTKAALQELLAERNLPKTGNVDELIERLVEDDTK